MKFVPSISPPRIIGVWDRLTVTGLSAVKAVKTVQSRTLPPLVTTPHGSREALRESPEESREPPQEAPERRLDPHFQGERRTYCRRVQHLPVLAELRSGLERRHHKQRAADPTEHIDIVA